MTYRIGGFVPFSEHTLELHFAEVHFRSAGQRKFNVNINSVRALSDYDIVARAGAANKAVREVFTASATYAGEIVIRLLRGSVDEPKVSGIVIR